MPTIQKGDAATSTAVNPLGTVCSAQTTAPLPTPTRRVPTIASVGHDDTAGSRSPRAVRIASSSEPAAIQRQAGMSSGGMVSRAIRMARYVVPQTRHTTTHAP